jgi:hypothetical protein
MKKLQEVGGHCEKIFLLSGGVFPIRKFLLNKVMLNNDCILIYERYKFLSETTDKRYLVIFGNIDTGLTRDVYVAAANTKEALHFAEIKISEDDPDFKYDHHYIVPKPWPKEYLRAVEED